MFMLKSVEKTPSKNHAHKGRLVETGLFECDECGKEFSRMLCSMKNRKFHYCGLKCRNTFGHKNRGSRRTDEWKRHMSLRNSGEDNPFYGKKQTEATLEKIRRTKQAKLAADPHAYKNVGSKPGSFSAEKNPFYGKKHTKETRERDSRA
jgi:NUMOD3 motif